MTNANPAFTTEWFTFEQKQPESSEDVIMIYYEEGDFCYLSGECSYDRGVILDEDGCKINLDNVTKMIWAYWPNP